MLDEKEFEMPFAKFVEELNSFLSRKGFQEQNENQWNEIIENSGVLYLDHMNNVGFKQQAFIEYLASVEIFNNARATHYNKLCENFNDVSWQNTAIFFAGKAKDLPGMINDVISKMPNNGLRDWFINTGGLGYLSQALYLTDKEERKSLIRKSLDNMVDSFYRIKDLTKTDSVQFKDLPLPLIAFMMGFWFTENFKSITLKTPLSEVFDELVLEYVKPDVNDFVGDFKLFLLAATLAHKNIADDTKFMNLIDRDSFVKNPVLMVVGDLFLETDAVQKKSFDPEIKKVITKQIRHHIKALKYILKEPAYRFNDNYSLIHKGDSDEDNNTISTFENDIHDD